MFSIALSYICMCILGEGPDDGGQDNACPRARKWILDHDGVTHMPSWGKTWLSILGLFDWSGSNPMPPEFWILPSFLPMHPVHALQVEIGELKGRLTEVISNCDAVCKRISAEGPESLRSSVKPLVICTVHQEHQS